MSAGAHVNGDRLSAYQAACWNLERTGRPLHAGALYTLDGPLDHERLQTAVGSALVGLPRWRARVLPVPFDLSSPTWEPARAFDVRQHVVRHVVRAPGDDEQLQGLASRLFARPLDRSRPLWEVHHLDGHRGTRSALLVKVHHCLLGGVHGSELEDALFDVSTRPRPRPAGAAPSSAPGGPYPADGARLWAAARDLAAAALAGVRAAAGDPGAALSAVEARVEAARELLALLRQPAPPTPLEGHVSTLRRVVSLAVPLAEVKALTTRLGGTTGDVVLAAFAGALRRWLQDRGVVPDRLELRALCATGVRARRRRSLEVVVMPLPVGIYDPLERLRQVRAAREAAVRSRAAERTARALAVLAAVPSPLQRTLGWLDAGALPVNTICTTAPASAVRLYLQGRRVEGVVPMVPLTQGVGMAFGVFGYGDVLGIGITFDPALLPDADRMPARLREALDELRGLGHGGSRVRSEGRRDEPARGGRPSSPRVA